MKQEVKSHMRNELTIEDSLTIIQRSLAQARRQLIMPDGPIAKAWGLAVLVGFGGMVIVRSISAIKTPLVAGLLIAITWAFAIAVALWFSSRLGRAYYATRNGVWSPVMGRLLWVWLLGIVIAVATALAAGLAVDGVIAVVAFFVASFYVMSGVLCFDNVELGIGLWIGAVNPLALLLGPIGYPAAMGILVGGGLIVSGYLDDRKWARITSLPGG